MAGKKIGKNLTKEINKLEKKLKTKKNPDTPSKIKKRKQRVTQYWYDVYTKALKLFGVSTRQVKTPTDKTLKRMRKKWKKEQYNQSSKMTVREAYKTQVSKEQSEADYNDTPRDEELRTVTATNMYDISLEIIQSFIDRVEQIYEDTIASPQKGSNSDVDWLILKYGGEITASKDELIGFVWQMYEDSNQQAEYVAKALQENEELEYTIAIAFVPPSDCIFLFYETLNNLKAIWKKVIDDARERAEQELS